MERRQPAPAGPRLRLRGLRRRHQPAQADQGVRPLRPRGAGRRQDPHAGLPVRGRQHPNGLFYRWTAPAGVTLQAGHRRPARRHRRHARGDGDPHGRRLGAARRRVPDLGPARAARSRCAGSTVPERDGQTMSVRKQFADGAGHPRQEVRGRLGHRRGRVRRQQLRLQQRRPAGRRRQARRHGVVLLLRRRDHHAGHVLPPPGRPRSTAPRPGTTTSPSTGPTT